MSGTRARPARLPIIAIAATGALGACAIDDRFPTTSQPATEAASVLPADVSESGSVNGSVNGSREVPSGSDLPAQPSPTGAADEISDNEGVVTPSAVTPSLPDASAPGSMVPSEREVPEVTCNGCVELLVPVTGPDQRAIFGFEFPAPGADFSAGVIEWRLQVPEASSDLGFYVVPYVQNGVGALFAGLYGTPVPLSASNFPPGQWASLTLDIAARSLESAENLAGFDDRAVERAGLWIGTTPEFTGAGVIRVLIDSVAFNGVPAVADVDFALSSEGLALDQFQVPVGTSEPIHHP